MIKRKMLASTAMNIVIGFENNAGWKMDGDKLAVDASGNPIYIDASGREMSVEQGTISRLNAEAKQHREAKEAAEAALKKYEGITDPELAKKALDTVSKLDAKALIDAGEVDKVKAEITRQYENQLSERDQALAERDQRLNQMTIDRVFDASEFIKEHVAVPPDMFRKTFGDHFRVEDGKVVAYGADGNPVYSKKRVGEPADTDEAFEILVGNYKYKDQILKAPAAGGTGNNGGAGTRGRSRVIRRSDFNAAPPVQQAEYAAMQSKGELTITD